MKSIANRTARQHLETMAIVVSHYPDATTKGRNNETKTAESSGNTLKV